MITTKKKKIENLRRLVFDLTDKLEKSKKECESLHDIIGKINDTLKNPTIRSFELNITENDDVIRALRGCFRLDAYHVFPEEYIRRDFARQFAEKLLPLIHIHHEPVEPGVTMICADLFVIDPRNLYNRDGVIITAKQERRGPFFEEEKE